MASRRRWGDEGLGGQEGGDEVIGEEEGDESGVGRVLISPVLHPEAEIEKQAGALDAREEAISGALPPVELSLPLRPRENTKTQLPEETETVDLQIAHEPVLATSPDPDPPLDELCLSLGCLVEHPHPIGRYLARGHVPRTYNDQWGLSDPPRMIWEAWARLQKGCPGEWDETVVQGFARAHFWDGPEAANEAGERLLGRRV